MNVKIGGTRRPSDKYGEKDLDEDEETKRGSCHVSKDQDLSKPAFHSSELTSREKQMVVDRLQETPVLAPRIIDRRLQEIGFRGQEVARRTGAVLAYRHLQRLRRIFLEHEDPLQVSAHENYMFMGASGSGKTFLVELLFREILKVPTVIADITQFTETGYVGNDVPMLLSRLFAAAGENRGWASCGVICIDEFDKIATNGNSTRFAGQGTSKDVSGFGVQRGLLNLLGGKNAPFPLDGGYSHHGAQMEMPLGNITFIACGAFSGFTNIANAGSEKGRIGFNGKPRQASSSEAFGQLEEDMLENTDHFSSYGMLPELIGRFSRIVPFQPLDADVLRSIASQNVLQQYLMEFAREGIELIVDDEVIDLIVKSAQHRKTGARGIRAALTPYLEKAAFEFFGGIGKIVRLYAHEGTIHIHSEGTPKSAPIAEYA